MSSAEKLNSSAEIIKEEKRRKRKKKHGTTRESAALKIPPRGGSTRTSAKALARPLSEVDFDADDLEHHPARPHHKNHHHRLKVKKSARPPASPPKDIWRVAETLFSHPLSASLLCPIHKGLMIDPVLSPCGHSFCRSCIACGAYDDTITCPLDETELDIDRVLPNLALLGQIKDLPVYCKFGCKKEGSALVPNSEGCQEKLTLATRDEHEENCPHAPALCPYCDHSFLKSKLQEHLQTCTSLPCPHKKWGCPFIGAKESLHEHLSDCSYESLKGFLANNERQIQTLEGQIREERKENAALRETITELLQRVSAIETKNTHYDSVIVRWNQGQVQIANSPVRPIVLPPEPVDEEPVYGFKCKGTFLGHEGPVWTLAISKSRNVLISGSSDKTIRVWDLETQKPRHTLTGHDGIVHAVVIAGKKLISGSSDKRIKVWNMKTMKCERTILGHNHTICKLVVEGNLLFSGSYTEIKVWDLDTFECIETLKGHNHWVRALCVSNGRLYSGCYNLIKIWDINTFTVIRDLTGHYGSIYSVMVVDGFLLAGTYENSIMVFELTSLKRVKELAGHYGAVYAVCIQEGSKRVFSGSYDSTIKVWNLENFRCFQTLKKHTSSVEALICDGESVYSASSDNTIKVFRYSK